MAVPSARAGLRFIFQALDLQKGDEVICSAFGYPVVPHLAKSLGYDLRLADCETETPMAGRVGALMEAEV